MHDLARAVPTPCFPARGQVSLTLTTAVPCPQAFGFASPVVQLLLSPTAPLGLPLPHPDAPPPTWAPPPQAFTDAGNVAGALAKARSLPQSTHLFQSPWHPWPPLASQTCLGVACGHKCIPVMLYIVCCTRAASVRDGVCAGWVLPVRIQRPSA